MTIAFADTVDRQENKDLVRWGVSLLLVLVFHVAVAWLLLPREAAVEPNKPPPPAALLDLPPLPLPGLTHTPGMHPPTKPTVVQPTTPKPPVEEVKPPAPPKPPVEQAKPPVLPPTSPIPKIAVPLPVAPQPLLSKPQPPKPQPPKTAPAPNLPPSASAAPVLLDPRRAWQLGVVDRIERFKLWPPEAIRYRLTGEVGLRLEIDRQGKILSYSLASSSGFALLDRATLDIARRMQRLPPLPSEISGQTYRFVLYIEWL